MRTKRLPAFVVLHLFLNSVVLFSADVLIRLKGEYLAYSYDHNQVYGQGVTFGFLSFEVTCQHIKIDIPSRIFYAYGDVFLQREEESLAADELLFRPDEKRGVLVRYGDRIEIEHIGEAGESPLLPKSPVLDMLSLPRIQKSFIYFTGQSLELTEDFQIYGYGVMLYIEGLESVGFRKFKLSEGIRPSRNGLFLEKIWYNRFQGLIGSASYVYQKEDRVDSLTQIHYEERSILKNYAGLKRQADIRTSTSVDLGGRWRFGLVGNYNSSSLWDTQVLLEKRWSERAHTRIDFSYNKPINQDGEAWFGLDSDIDGGAWGHFFFSGRYEVQDQVLTRFTYDKQLLENLNFLLNSSYSRLLIRGSQNYSEILAGSLDLSYTAKVFNLSTNYFLNNDLFGDQLLSQPQLRIGLNPFAFYRGLLRAAVTNVFIYSHIRLEDSHRNAHSNNTILNLATAPLFMRPSTSIDFTLNVEQFLEKEGRHFTSGGGIIHAVKDFGRGLSLEAYYSLRSRRRTRGWLIEGTTSQDLSTILRVNPSEKLNGWISLSYDPKHRQWRQSFADVSVGIVRKWKFHSLLNYDFLLKKLNNIELYLIREAGRFQIRFIWRSLSRQILVELVPN